MSLHQILLRPSDVLFFRDGRPMSGSLAGHTAAWPLPDVTNHALHAALHRAGLTEVHQHRDAGGTDRNRQFGSLKTAGPFPVATDGQWYFPRPRDAQQAGCISVTLRPVATLPGLPTEDPWFTSSLPDPLEYAVANTQPPSKDSGGEPWISSIAFSAYLRDATVPSNPAPLPDKPAHFLTDADIADTEHSIGIAIDPLTGTTGQGDAKGRIYSAHYLRLREGIQLGLFAEAMDKLNSQEPRRDLLIELIRTQPQAIIVGGQQRICSASLSAAANPLPLPQGLNVPTDFKPLTNGKFAVKWILLTPAIWPKISGTTKDGRPMTPHPGGWLPNWIDAATGKVLLKAGQRGKRSYHGKHSRGFTEGAVDISAHLVAALIPKPLVVTGWAASDPDIGKDGGAKSTHLAVPAGAVYYFEADSPEEAAKLANALNWHGTHPALIQNRRSTLMGEKGFGLGACGTWEFHRAPLPLTSAT
jgi:CRISPR/Cas system CMR-associated protein Cmr3 (group 5 of RAMP superfamily)